jgi:hypothetical protein
MNAWIGIPAPQSRLALPMGEKSHKLIKGIKVQT